VGVARQYCGQLGKPDNCRVAVSVSVATAYAGLPVAYRLYVPQAWVEDRECRTRAGMPEEVAFQTKPEIALDQLIALTRTDTPQGVVLAQAGYGNHGGFRRGGRGLNLSYVLGIQPSAKVWEAGSGPLPPAEYSGCGRPPKLPRRSLNHQPLTVLGLAQILPCQAYHVVAGREGSNEALSSRFAAVRVRAAHRDYRRSEPSPEEWLLIEWPEEQPEPSKYWLSTLAAGTTLEDLMSMAKLRRRIQRDYHDLKQEIGLGRYEGRGWRGFHHHAGLHCGIRVFGFGAALFSPLRPKRPANLHGACSTQRLEAKGISRSGQSDITHGPVSLLKSDSGVR
jgi:SRSO17 transposase